MPFIARTGAGGRACALIAALSLAGAAGSGCLIVPKTKKTAVRTYDHNSPLEPDGEARPVVTVQPSGPSLWVQAHWLRTCTSWRSHVVEYRVEKTSGVEGPGSLGGGGCGEACLVVAAVILVAAPLTLLVSGIVTAVVVNKSKPQRRKEVESFTPQRFRCDAPGAGFRLRAVVHGIGEVAAVTDAMGQTRIDLPPGGAARPTTVYVDAPTGVAPIVIRRGPPGLGPPGAAGR
ncbi:MAG TPA: hypothetical protein VKZ63_22285 [Kofleriaceae bacterium]|nr:hypothetical protein [Kofleriaceae bacterium]